jgi:hypothetical protein
MLIEREGLKKMSVRMVDPGAQRGARLKTDRAGVARWTAATLAVITLGFASAPALAATQEQLETRVQALAEELEQVKQELAALKEQRAAGGQPASPPVAGNSALPNSAPAGGAAPDASALPATTGYASAGVPAGGPTWFGYGELNYSRPAGNPSATTADLARFVLGAGYRFDEKTHFVSELELEHAVSSADDVGEIEVEQAYVEHELTPSIFAKAGLILIPSGTLNENHEPTRYYGVYRNFVETAIIPSTWREGGFALQGNTSGGLRWDLGLTTGFDLSKWNAMSLDGQASPLASIHQELAIAHARDVSGFGALNYTGLPALRVGASVFTGGASQGQPGTPSAGVTLWEGHARWAPGAWDLAGLYARGHISGTRQLNLTLIGNPTLIPEEFFGWYVQSAYHLIDRGTWSLTPFVRYEQFNTASQYAVLGTGFAPAALPDRKVWTAGFNWMIAPGVVVKADYLDFRGTGDGHASAANSGALVGNRFDVGVGYQF